MLHHTEGVAAHKVLEAYFMSLEKVGNAIAF
jgi:hypothetical protein